MTTVYIGERQSGKTTTLIEMSEKTGATIVEFRDGVRRVDPSSIKFCDEKNAVLCEMSKTP